MLLPKRFQSHINTIGNKLKILQFEEIYNIAHITFLSKFTLCLD